MPIDAKDVKWIEEPKLGLLEMLYLPAIVEGLQHRKEQKPHGSRNAGCKLKARHGATHAPGRILHAVDQPVRQASRSEQREDQRQPARQAPKQAQAAFLPAQAR